MKNKLLVTLLILGVATIAFAAVPDHINYQGILRNLAGDLQTGTFSMTFRIFDEVTGGNELLIDEQNNIKVSNGLYNAEVGTITGAIFDGGDRWLEVEVEGEVLAPRLKINSVAYAWQAENAATADSAINADYADYATLSGTATNAGTVDDISANTSATANELLALDTNKQFKGASISAEAAGNTFALFVDGKLGATRGIGLNPGSTTCGIATLESSGSTATVNNTSVTANSIILITPYFNGTGATYKWLKIKTITPSTSFIVETFDGASPVGDEEFFYLIIN